MNSIINIVVTISLLICHTLASQTVQVLQGPGSKTTLAGPDGSSLASSQPGGTLVTDGSAAHSGLVAASPALLGTSNEVVVGGPAGRITTTYTLAGPAIVPAVAAPIVAPPVVAGPAIATPVAAPVAVGPAVVSAAVAGPVVAGRGLLNEIVGLNEGGYVPDGSEALYDDGSYRGLE